METINVEIILKKNHSENKVIALCEAFLQTRPFSPGVIFSSFNPEEQVFLHEIVDHIIIGEHKNLMGTIINLTDVQIKWYVYALNKCVEQIESECDDNGEEIQLATISILPTHEYFNLWENLIYDISIKDELLRFAYSALLFADKNINCNTVSCNRVVLLHGPPGTGKTSLCKALAQKLTVRLQNRFKRGCLLEINSHSLFSKWFSESGKLVTKLFSKVKEFLKDPEALIFVLIDEVESLAHARENCMNGTEPSDSIRVVNAVLTQIDQIKNHPNVLILTTSNMTEAIDLAFVDRADIIQFIDLPGPEAIYQIYFSCIQELMKQQIIQPMVVIPQIRMLHDLQDKTSTVYDYSRKLLEISEMSNGFSGRTLRRIPFLAHALFLNNDSVSIEEFFEAMAKAIQRQHQNVNHFNTKIEVL